MNIKVAAFTVSEKSINTISNNAAIFEYCNNERGDPATRYKTDYKHI